MLYLNIFLWLLVEKKASSVLMFFLLLVWHTLCKKFAVYFVLMMVV